MKIASLLTLTIGLALVTALSTQAHAASATVLERKTTEFFTGGNIRTIKCSIALDGIVITRSFGGLTTTEEKSFNLSGPIDTKIDEVVTTKSEEKTEKPSMDMTFSFTAFKSGSTTPVVLSSYDGTTGVNVFNPSSGAGILREILQTNCGK